MQKAGSDCYKLAIKVPEEDKQGIKEVTESLAAARETSMDAAVDNKDRNPQNLENVPSKCTVKHKSVGLTGSLFTLLACISNKHVHNMRSGDLGLLHAQDHSAQMSKTGVNEPKGSWVLS